MSAPERAIAAATAFAERLCACGFQARASRSAKGEERIYLSGYGRDITAMLRITAEVFAGSIPHFAPAQLIVTSSWKRGTLLNTQRCKGVKHAIWKDLHTAGVMPERPPERWIDVSISSSNKPIRHFIGGAW